MNEGSIIVIIGLILAAISTAVILKNAVLRYKLGDKGYKAALAVIIIIIALLCSTLVIGAGYDIKSILYQLLESKNMDPEWVTQLKRELGYKRSTFYISAIIGYLSLIIYFFLYKSILKITSKKQAQAEKNRWDWNKVSK